MATPDGKMRKKKNQRSAEPKTMTLYRVHTTFLSQNSRPFQGLIIFFKAKQNWKNTRFITKCVSLKAYIYWLAHYVMQCNKTMGGAPWSSGRTLTLDAARPRSIPVGGENY